MGLLGLAACASVPPTAPEAAPACADAVYAAVLSTRKHQLSGENPVVGVFRSADGGATWTHHGWRQGRTFAVMAPRGGCGDTLVTASGNGVLQTTDGRFWRIATGWQITEVQDVTIDPWAPRRLFAATPYGLFRSDDAGDTWRDVSSGLASRFVGSVRVDRAQAARVWAGTEAGLFVSDDGGHAWQPTAVTSPVRSVRQSPHDARHLVVGLEAQGVAVSRDGGATWAQAEGPRATIYEAEYDPMQPDVLYAGGWQTGVLRSADGGRTWASWGLDGESVHSLAVLRTGAVLAGTMGNGLFARRGAQAAWQPVAPEVFEAGQVWDLYVEGEQ